METPGTPALQTVPEGMPISCGYLEKLIPRPAAVKKASGNKITLHSPLPAKETTIRFLMPVGGGDLQSGAALSSRAGGGACPEVQGEDSPSLPS